jgi:hypothetical protein
MKKYSSIISIVLIVAIGYFTQGFTPWWSISLIALIIALLFQLNPSKGALAGFLAGLILWGGLAFYRAWPMKDCWPIVSGACWAVFPDHWFRCYPA